MKLPQHTQTKIGMVLSKSYITYSVRRNGD